MLLTACLEAEQWNINVKTPMCQSWNVYLPNEEKAEFILFSEVVQRYSGDEKVIRCQAPLTKLKYGRPETGAIPVFHRWQEWLQLMRILIFWFWLNNLYTDKKWKSYLLGSSYVEVYSACKWSPLLLLQGHVVSKF